MQISDDDAKEERNEYLLDGLQFHPCEENFGFQESWRGGANDAQGNEISVVGQSHARVDA